MDGGMHVLNTSMNLNTIFMVLTEDQNAQVEKEYIFEHNQTRGAFIPLLASTIDSAHPIEFSPKIGDQLCKHQIIKVNENEFYVAYLEKPYGNYEFGWQSNDIIYLMIIRAASWVTEKWALDLVAIKYINKHKKEGSKGHAKR